MRTIDPSGGTGPSPFHCNGFIVQSGARCATKKAGVPPALAYRV
jgi:hypothetical protein